MDPWLKTRSLRRKLLAVYFLLFVLPLVYLLYVVAVLLQTAHLPLDVACFARASLLIGLPAVLVMSVSALVIMYRALSPVLGATKNAQSFIRELHGEKEGTATQERDEARRISSYVSDLITELRQRLTDVDRYAQQLHEANEKLVQLAVHDGLTGLYNQKHIQHILPIEIERASRFKHPLSVMMVDVDGFKQFNDSYGHIAGDQALRHIAHLLRDHVRSVDIPCRYGGEEFLLVLPEAGDRESLMIGERLRGLIEGHPFATGFPGRTAHLTVSIGLARLSPQTATAKELISLADTCLYRAKRSGKNKVCA